MNVYAHVLSLAPYPPLNHEDLGERIHFHYYYRNNYNTLVVPICQAFAVVLYKH